MALVRFDGFNGANLAQQPLLVPAGVGVACWNRRPGRGDLRPWNGPLTVASVPAGMQSIYRMGRDAVSDASYWLAWAARVSVARGMIPTDAVERTFWSGDGPPKWTDNSIGLGSAPYPTASGVRLLGVPAPNAAPSLTELVAGTGADESRAYVTVWRNDRGEISAPSDPVTITCKPGASIRVTRNASVPAGAYGLSHWEVYRTVAGAEGDFVFVADATSATASIDTGDTVNPAQVLLSEDWDFPDAGLQGFKTLWNGIMVAFKGKNLYFCEAYRPFAWPEDYRLPLDDEIVAIGRWRTNALALTKGQPYLITGSSPAAMTAQPLEIDQACISALGVVDFGHGTAWPSRDGLCYIGEGGFRMPTAGRALQEDWLALNPASIVAGRYEGLYVASYDPGGGRKSFIIDPTLGPGDPVGLDFCDLGFTACHYDQLADALFVLNGTNVQKWNAGSPLVARFDSRTELLPRPATMTWVQVTASTYPVTLTVWGNDAAVVTDLAVPSAKPLRLPRNGHRAEQWRIRVSGGPVQGVALAGSIHELRVGA